MKNIFIILFLLFPILVFSQIDYGFKAGVNLNTSSSISVISDAFENKINKSNFKGYYIGSYISFEALIFDLRTEIQYSTTRNNNDLTQQKIEQLKVLISLGKDFQTFLLTFFIPPVAPHVQVQ